MYCIGIILISFIIFECKAIELELKNYGPYKVNTSVELCKGYLKNNITSIESRFYYDDEGRSMLSANITSYFSGGPVLFRRRIYIWKNTRYVQAFPPTIYKTCYDAEYEFPLKFVKLVNGVCKMSKGEFNIDIDFNKSAKFFLHDKFFYGLYKAILEAYVKEGNAICFVIYMDVTPA